MNQSIRSAVTSELKLLISGNYDPLSCHQLNECDDDGIPFDVRDAQIVDHFKQALPVLNKCHHPRFRKLLSQSLTVSEQRGKKRRGYFLQELTRYCIEPIWNNVVCKEPAAIIPSAKALMQSSLKQLYKRSAAACDPWLHDQHLTPQTLATQMLANYMGYNNISKKLHTALNKKRLDEGDFVADIRAITPILIDAAQKKPLTKAQAWKLCPADAIVLLKEGRIIFRKNDKEINLSSWQREVLHKLAKSGRNFGSTFAWNIENHATSTRFQVDTMKSARNQNRRLFDSAFQHKGQQEFLINCCLTGPFTAGIPPRGGSAFGNK